MLQSNGHPYPYISVRMSVASSRRLYRLLEESGRDLPPLFFDVVPPSSHDRPLGETPLPIRPL